MREQLRKRKDQRFRSCQRTICLLLRSFANFIKEEEKEENDGTFSTAYLDSEKSQKMPMIADTCRTSTHLKFGDNLKA
jgi:hypothetical protein